MVSGVQLLTDEYTWYAEHLGCSAQSAKRIAFFMRLTRCDKLIQKPELWSKGDMVRVYFGMKSQNSLFSIEMLMKSFYDAGLNDVFIIRYGYGTWTKNTLKEVSEWTGRSMFSGSKTRKEIIEFSRRFYEQKDNWN